jgi:putative pyruvate formate lyase activating enzyme
MPDMKYSAEQNARRFSGIDDYPQMNRAAVKEMHRQVGDLQLDDNGVATSGLLVRHLVLPGGLAGTAEVCHFLSWEISVNTYLNVMAQYHPCYRAYDFPELARSISRKEFFEAIEPARSCGLQRLDRIEPRPFAGVL